MRFELLNQTVHKKSKSSGKDHLVYDLCDAMDKADSVIFRDGLCSLS
jgi:hypothetical protein